MKSGTAYGFKTYVAVSSPDREKKAKIQFHLVSHWSGMIELHKCHGLNVVKSMMGHRNTSSTKVYLHTEQVAFVANSDELNAKGVVAFDEAAICRF